MREFSFITVAQIVREVRDEGVPRFSRSTFYRLIKRQNWPMPVRTSGNWRRFTRKEADQYKELIKKSYGL